MMIESERENNTRYQFFVIPKRDQRAVIKCEIMGGWRKACAACLCFVPRDYLVCSIAFVVYSRVEDLHALRRRSHARLISRRSQNVRVRLRVRFTHLAELSSLFFSLSLSFPFSLPPLHRRRFVILHCLRQYMRRRECANPRRGFRRSGSARFTRELFIRPAVPDGTLSRQFPMTSLPRDVSIIISSSQLNLELLTNGRSTSLQKLTVNNVHEFSSG